MHYTGTIWRPPYEASSLLLQATAGCTHHSCKFCTLYHDLPFSFRMSPMEEIENDLQEVQLWNTNPVSILTSRLQGLPHPDRIQRVFLTGANPFVLQYERLMAIAERIRSYLPSVKTIGCFARIPDIASKTDQELRNLKNAGYDGLTIGMETADDDALTFMKKGYRSCDILLQGQRLDTAGIFYHFFYLAGISGAGNGEKGASLTAQLCNQLHPQRIGANMLTIYPDSELYAEIQAGRFQESTEIEKYQELKTLVEHLDIPVWFAALGASNAIALGGTLPQEKSKLLSLLHEIITKASEEDLRHYRETLPHL